jgi:hypothetical protein
LPQHPTHYFPTENADVLVIVVHQNIRLSQIIVSDILKTDHFPIAFHILHHAITKKLSESLNKSTDGERSQRHDSNSILPRLEISSGRRGRTNKAASEITTSTVMAYRLSASKFELSELNRSLGLDRSLKHEKRLRELWHDARDPMCKQTFYLISKTISLMTCRRALEL